MKKFSLAFFFILLGVFLFGFGRDVSAGGRITRPINNLGMVGYWTFDGPDVNFTTNIASDRSGSGNNGAITNMSTSTAPAIGKLGQALSFDGSDDYVNAGTNSSLNVTTGWTASFWFKANAIHDTNNYIFSRRDSADGSGYSCYINNTNDRLRCLVYDGTTVVGDDDTTTTIVPGRWYHGAATYNGSNTLRVYINGVQEATETATVSLPTETVSFLIGIYNSLAAEYDFNGLIDEVRIYNRALTAQEVKQLYLAGAAHVNTSQNIRFRDSSLVGEWSFDGADVSFAANKAYDRSGQGNDGTITNMSTSTAPAIGKLGQALSFDGSDDYVSCPADGTNVLGQLISSFTKGSISFWFKASNTNRGALFSVSKSTDAFNVLAIEYSSEGNGTKFIGLYAYPPSGNEMNYSTPAVSENVWHHVVAVQDAVAPKIYVDGVSQSLTERSGGPHDDSNWIGDITGAETCRIGNRKVNSADDLRFPGLIDEVRVYNRALTAQEVKQLYLAGSVRANTSQNIRLRDSSLVGEWSFDGPDVSFTANKAYDRSGQGNDGTITNMSTSTAPAIGKLGQALSFDGSDDYVSVSAASSLNFDPTNGMTVSAWAYFDTLPPDYDMLITKGANNQFEVRTLTSGGVTKGGGIAMDNTGGASDFHYIDIEAGGTSLQTNRWYHFVLTYAGGTTLKFYLDGVLDRSEVNAALNSTQDLTKNLEIGRRSDGNYIDGLIDEVRVYNRALSAAEVKQLYNMGR
ncbi:LamG domain-containing protein [Candidatus Parcubacteria bacterium]|nr:LamG domain-containing protein [Candidatus Parcubacteria bacterium]